MSVVDLLSRLVAGLVLAAGGACATGAAPGHDAAPPAEARLTVENPSGDTWSLDVAGAPRGTVAPASRVTLRALAPGAAVVLARNDALQLAQRHVLTLVAGSEVTLILRRPLARLRVTNGRDVPVEVLIDGVAVGWAAPRGETLLTGLPAGQRTIVARSGSGPGAVRAERYLPEDGETRWAVPAQIAVAGAGDAVPRPPAGQGLIWMRNTSRFDVRVFIGGEEVSFVAAGATAEIVVAPGTHALVVHIEGADATSAHEVTLQPNQTAAWEYGGS